MRINMIKVFSTILIIGILIYVYFNFNQFSKCNVVFIIGCIGLIPIINNCLNYFQIYLCNNAFRFFFGVSSANKWLIVCPNQKSSLSGPDSLTTLGDSFAQSLIQTKLIKHGIQASFQQHSDTFLGSKSGNMILICGPGGLLGCLWKNQKK